jgi:hypothetical protein
MRGSDSRINYDTVIVGVVRDALYSNMREPAVPVYYSAAAQAARQRNMYFYVRTATDPLQSAGAIRAARGLVRSEPARDRLADDARTD